MKKLIFKFVVLLLPVFFLGFVIVVCDPYFHYHKPIMKYILDSERWQNDGILKNFEYDAIITGTSLDQNAKNTELDKLFKVNSVKTTYSGGNFAEISSALKKAFNEDKKIKLITMSFGYTRYMDTEYDDWGTWELADFPFYMYDTSLLNDWQYIYNLDTVLHCFKNIKRTIENVPSTSFDEYSSWNYLYKFGKDIVISQYKRPIKSKNKEKITDDYINKLKKNINYNFIEIAKAHPETEFYLYFAPLSVVWWDEYNQNGILDFRIDGIEEAIKELLTCDNIKVFYFVNETDITTNLSNYTDLVHYGEWINSKMLQDMAVGKNQLTKENYKDAVNKTREFYRNYDYDSLFANN